MGGVKVTVPMSLFMVQNAKCVKSENLEAPKQVGWISTYQKVENFGL